MNPIQGKSATVKPPVDEGGNAKGCLGANKFNQFCHGVDREVRPGLRGQRGPLPLQDTGTIDPNSGQAQCLGRNVVVEKALGDMQDFSRLAAELPQQGIKIPC